MKKIYLLTGFIAISIYISGQNIGIGTTVPTEQLHTTKGVRFESLAGTASRLVYADSTGKLLTFKNAGITNTNNTPAAIPDGSCTGVLSTINFSGLPASIQTANMSVKLNITHTSDYDLCIYLIAPNGSILNLLFSNGGVGDNFVNTIFSDDAPLTPDGGTAPFSDYYKPMGNMAMQCALTPTAGTFGAIGGGSIDPNGTWTLRVFDVLGVDIGTLENWSIDFGNVTGVENYVPKWRNGTLSRLSNVFDNGINVGIGTSTPTSKLSVGGNASISGNLKIGNVGSNAQSLSVYGSGYFNDISTLSATISSVLTVSGTASLLGSVGIGTSSPLANLHVNVTGTNAYAGIMISSSSPGGKQITINQGSAGKLNFTVPNVIDLVTMDFNNNRVGINVVTPGHLLQLGNDDAFKPSTSTWGVLSDRRLKENIDPFTDGLNLVLQMKPVWFNYNGLGGTSKGERAIGTVAQELQQLAPYMISEVNSSGKEDADTKYLGVNYHALFFVLVNAVKEQNKMIEDLKEENNAQKKLNDEILIRLSKLEAMQEDKNKKK